MLFIIAMNSMNFSARNFHLLSFIELSIAFFSFSTWCRGMENEEKSFSPHKTASFRKRSRRNDKVFLSARNLFSASATASHHYVLRCHCTWWCHCSRAATHTQPRCAPKQDSYLTWKFAVECSPISHHPAYFGSLKFSQSFTLDSILLMSNGSPGKAELSESKWSLNYLLHPAHRLLLKSTTNRALVAIRRTRKSLCKRIEAQFKDEATRLETEEE